MAAEATSTNIKNAIIKTKIENAIYELMVKSSVDNIYLTDGTTTLASKLAEMITAINEREKSADVDTKISTAINNLIDGAPATYDTLKEISDYLTSHNDEYTALVTTVGKKVDKVTGKGLSTNDFTTTYKNLLDSLGSLAKKSAVSESDLDSSLKSKVNAAAEGNHNHDNKTVLDGITADEVSAWDGKPNIYVQSSQPTTMNTNDIWIQPI
jgi:hypothetical protein